MARKLVDSTFDDQAMFMAERFMLDARNIKDAYAQKPESLSALFNTVTKSQESRSEALWLGGLGTFLALRLPPLAGAILAVTALYAGYQTYRINQAGKRVQAEVEQFKTASFKAPQPVVP